MPSRPSSAESAAPDTRPLNILFAGTPEFACPALHYLIEHERPTAVLTQPDRPSGRGRKLTASPVKQLALEHDLTVLSPNTLQSEQIQLKLAELKPDLLISAAYGLLLPKAVLELPTYGCWNLHASLLPRWRGASPIQQAILAGDTETGISLMQMDIGLDTGDILFTRKTTIDPDETTGELQLRLSHLAADTLHRALSALRNHRMPVPQKQDDEHATHAPRIRKSDARIDWNRPAAVIAGQVRGYNPWPVCFGMVDGEPVRIFKARAVQSANSSAPPGQRAEAKSSDQLHIACGEGILAIEEIQSPGRKRMTSAEWLRARGNRGS